MNLSTEELKREYVTSVVESSLAELDEIGVSQQYIIDDVFDIVSGVEKLVDEYGIDGWSQGSYPASKELQLHRHTCGPLSVGIFDMSVEEYDTGHYSFSLYRCL